MGVNINIHVYNRKNLENDIDVFVLKNGGYREGVVHPTEFLDRIGEHFGILDKQQYTVLWNEYYEEYNAGTNFLLAVENYYFPSLDEADFWSSSYHSFYPSESYLDALEDAFPDEFHNESEFVAIINRKGDNEY